MKNWVYLVGIVAAVAVLGPSLVENVFAWTLNVQVVDKPFSDTTVLVKVTGPDGWVHDRWYDFSSIKTGPGSGEVNVNVPESAIPSGEMFEVCVSTNLILSIIPSCQYFTHGEGDAGVTMSLS